RIHWHTPSSPISFATHRRSIHVGRYFASSPQPERSAAPSEADYLLRCCWQERPKPITDHQCLSDLGRSRGHAKTNAVTQLVRPYGLARPAMPMTRESDADAGTVELLAPRRDAGKGHS